MTKEEKQAIVSECEGRSSSLDAGVADRHEISIEDLEEIMEDAGYEACEDCGFWCECGELADEDGNTVPCESCR